MSGAVAPARRAPAPIERAFLPAALEIVETPASPTLRYTGWAICLFLATALVWAWFGKVDMIAAAAGKAAPAGRTKQIQAFEAGVVRKILVEDGDRVQAGQQLILLDPTLATADRDRFADQFMRARLDVARLTALLAETEGGKVGDPFADLAAPDEALREMRGRFAADRANRQARLAAADREIAGKRSEQASLDAELAKIDATLPMTMERANIRKYTFEKGVGSKLDYLNAAQQKAELENERKVTAAKASATEAALQAAIAARAQIAAETERDWRSDLQKAMRDRAEAQSELAKAERRTGLTSVTAPIEGVVQDLAVHTEGGVVQAGQQLLRVSPTDGALVIEAVVENKDAGFVRVGQEAEIKVEAFPFTRYGFLHGRVASIARDATSDPEEQQSRGATLDRSPNELRRSHDLIYVARIAVDNPTLDVDGVATRLEPGMAITAEIKTGRRRVLDYLLSPIAQRGHEALRER
ncbi:HlyD family type I secretion membrane fusion protein [Rhodoblastus acidophilus]|uniref:HlyD family type I secretion periplasmic adaptor subunit n=1 Tax=Rhodoblastus acidophilus TaxID=1074 RepID=UPI0022259DD0|nr:HlyD family type I secretion periplasmic adaptor subunit [Rhodoblastus acidophilus]MCW2318234.1 HlyD family type I secretion membrane fusion protein [Rhodoblastus acidophilus]